MVNNRQLLARLSLVACFLSLGVIGLGAFTRLIDAGLGCPDWPGCYGQMIVPLTEMARQKAALHYPGSHLITYKAWAEMIHRYCVGALSLFMLAIVVLIFSRRALRVRSNSVLAVLMTLLLVYQIILGQLTVTLKLLPIIVSQHLLGGFFILTLLWLVYLNNTSYVVIVDEVKAAKKILPWAVIALVLIVLQIMLGAWTSTNYASLSCPDFPFCSNERAISFQFKEAFHFFAPVGVNYEGGVLSTTIRQTIQMSHRLGALIVTIYLFMFVALARTKLTYDSSFGHLLYLMLGLLCIQLCIGISNVIFKLPLVTAISHTLIAVLLLLSVVTVVFKLVVMNRRVAV